MELEVKIHKIKDGGYRTSYVNPITKKRHRQKFLTKEEALMAKHKIEGKNRSGDKAFFMNMSVSKVCSIHLRECPNSKLDNIKKVYNDFLNSFGNALLRDLTKTELASWFSDLKMENNYSLATLHRIKSGLNHLFNYLVDKGILLESPLSGIKFDYKKDQKRKRVVFSSDELLSLLNYVKGSRYNHLYPYMYTLICTGARRSEILKLKWEDVDFNTGLLSLHKTKNGSTRQLHMNTKLKKVLQEHKATSDSQKVFKLTVAMLRHYKSQINSKFSYNKKWTYHAFRHSFAYNYLKRGGQMYELQAILGHKSIQMTVDLYGQLQACDIEKVSPYEF